MKNLIPKTIGHRSEIYYGNKFIIILYKNYNVKVIRIVLCAELSRNIFKFKFRFVVIYQFNCSNRCRVIKVFLLKS